MGTTVRQLFNGELAGHGEIDCDTVADAIVCASELRSAGDGWGVEIRTDAAQDVAALVEAGTLDRLPHLWPGAHQTRDGIQLTVES